MASLQGFRQKQMHSFHFSSKVTFTYTTTKSHTYEIQFQTLSELLEIKITQTAQIGARRIELRIKNDRDTSLSLMEE